MICDSCEDKFNCYSHCKKMEEWEELTKNDIDSNRTKVVWIGSDEIINNRDKIIKDIVEKSFNSVGESY